MFRQIRFWIGLSIILAIGGAVTYGYIEYRSMKSQLTTLEVENNSLSETVDRQNAMLNRMREDQERLNDLNNDLIGRSIQAETRAQQLQSLLAEHDLEFLASERPGLIERRINDGTQQVFDDLERLTNPSD